MIVIIPAAGEGKRLAEIQPGVPKALKKIGGKPMIEHTLDKLCRMQEHPDNIYIVFRPGDHLPFLTSLRYERFDGWIQGIPQPIALGTGDAVWRALESIGEPYDGRLLVMYPDVLVDLGVEDFISKGNAVMTKPRDGSGSCVYRSLTEPDRIISVSEKPRYSMGNMSEKLGDWYFVENAMYLYLALKCLGGLSWEGYQGVHISVPQKSAKEFNLTQAIDAMMRCGIPFRGVRVDDYCSLGNPEGFNKGEEWLKNVQKQA